MSFKFIHQRTFEAVLTVHKKEVSQVNRNSLPYINSPHDDYIYNIQYSALTTNFHILVARGGGWLGISRTIKF